MGKDEKDNKIVRIISEIYSNLNLYDKVFKGYSRSSYEDTEILKDSPLPHIECCGTDLDCRERYKPNFSTTIQM